MKYRHKTTGEEARQIVKGYYDVGKEQIHKRFIENSCDWERLIDNDYEILSFYSGYEGSPMAYIFEKLSNGLYSKGTGSCTLKHGLEYWKIYSVKRLSDGEIFTVGDKVEFKNHSGREVIQNITIEQDELWLNFSENELCRLSGIKKAKIPLFTTEDETDIYGGEKLHLVTKCFTLGVGLNFTKDDFKDPDYLFFAKKENAEKYIRDNEKKYSLKDMVKIANHWAYIKSVTPEVALKVIAKWEK